MDDTNETYSKLRHIPFSQAIDAITKQLRKLNDSDCGQFENREKAAGEAVADRQMRTVLAKMGEYRKQKGALEQMLALAREAMDKMKDSHKSVQNIEDRMATGGSTDTVVAKIMQPMLNVLSIPTARDCDKQRLILLTALSVNEIPHDIMCDIEQ
ncbi:Sec1-like protein, partial [Kipferlia bialata]|eukprot:g15077.t1